MSDTTPPADPPDLEGVAVRDDGLVAAGPDAYATPDAADEVWAIEFKPVRDPISPERPVAVRMRKLLKIALRELGMKAVRIGDPKPGPAG